MQRIMVTPLQQDSGRTIRQMVSARLENPMKDIVYTGNVTDNLFNGDITFTGHYSDTSREDTFVGHAENGTWNLIRQEGDEWIFAESSSGGYWYKNSQEDLAGDGVWAAY